MDSSGEDISYSVNLSIEAVHHPDDEKSRYPLIDFLILLSKHPNLQKQLESSRVILDFQAQNVTVISAASQDQRNALYEVLDNRISYLTNCITPIFEDTSSLEVKGFLANREVQKKLREKQCSIFTGDTLMDTINLLERLKDFQIRGTLKSFSSSLLVAKTDFDGLNKFQSELEMLFHKLRYVETIYDSQTHRVRPSNEYAQESVELILKQFDPNYLIVNPQIEFDQKAKEWKIQYKVVTFINQLFLKKFSSVVSASKSKGPPPKNKVPSPIRRAPTVGQFIARPQLDVFKRDNARSWEIKVNYFQFKFFKHYLAIKHLHKYPLDSQDFSFFCEKINKLCSPSDINNFKTNFGSIKFTGNSNTIQLAHDFILKELQNMRTRRYNFPYHISFKSMLALAIHKKEKVLTRIICKILKNYAEETGQLLCSKFFVESADISRNEVNFILIYDNGVEDTVIRVLDKELEYIFTQIEELILDINYPDLYSIFRQKMINLDNYFEDKEAMFIKKSDLDNEVIIAGARSEIIKFKKFVPSTVSMKSKHSNLVVQNVVIEDDDYNYDGSNEKFKVVYKPKPKTKAPDPISNLMMFDTKSAIQRPTQMIVEKPNPDNDIITHQQEMNLTQWKELKAIGADRFMKLHNLQYKELTTPKPEEKGKETITWEWKLNNKWVPFCSEFIELIEEGFGDEQEVLLDAAVVSCGETMVFDFSKAEIVNLITGKSGTLVYVKERNEIFFAPKVSANIEKISDELTDLVLKEREKTKADMIKVFGDDFVVMHSEKLLKHMKSRKDFEIQRTVTGESKPREEEKILIQLTGTRKNMGKFLLDHLKIQMPNLNSLLPDRNFSSDTDLNLYTENNQNANTSFLSDNEAKLVDLLDLEKKKPSDNTDLLDALINMSLDKIPCEENPIEKVSPKSKRKLKICSPVFTLPFSKPEIAITTKTLQKHREKIIAKADDLDVRVEFKDNLMITKGPGDYKELMNYVVQLEREEFILQNFEILTKVILNEENQGGFKSEDEQFIAIKGKIDDAFGPHDPKNFEIKRVHNRILFESWLDKCIKLKDDDKAAEEFRKMVLNPNQKVHLLYDDLEKHFPIGIACIGPLGDETYVFEKEEEAEIDLLTDTGIVTTVTKKSSLVPITEEINLLD